MLTHRADDREVHALPPSAERLDTRLDVFDEIPGWEVTDVSQRTSPPDDARAAGEDGVGCIPREHLAAIKDSLSVVKRVACTHLRFLDGLDECKPLVRLELPHYLAEKGLRAHFVVCIARFDVSDLRETLVEHCER